MQQTLFLILATSMWTIGLYMATMEGEILHPVKLFAEKIFGTLSNPFISCPFCMPSVYGFFVCGIFHLFNGFHLQWYWYVVQWVFVVPSASALNYILFNLIRILKGYANLFEEKNETE